MGSPRRAEELRFFELDEVGAAAREEPARRTAEELPVAGGATDPVRPPATSALQRRLEQVSAIARHPAPPGSADELADPDDGEGATGEETLSIASFYERVRRALGWAFPGEVWVSGEIRGLKESRGHRYLELADEGSEAVRGSAQQLEVVCWAGEWPRIAVTLAEAGVSLEVGRVVRVRGRVSVWEGGSRLRFVLRAIDVEALLGGIAAARHRLLQALAGEGLLEANRRLVLSPVPLRVGLVTSPGSEAHRDFVGRLRRSGYAFEVQLERSLVQGAEAPAQLASAVRRLRAFAPDVAVIVRGGGGRGDLAAFDSEELARAIATAPFPVWTGVGHSGDRSVADEVAHRACITPTACGEQLVAVVTAYTDGVAAQLAELSRLARARLGSAGERLDRGRDAVARGVRHQLERRGDALATTRASLTRGGRGVLDRERTLLEGRARRAGAAAALLLERHERDQHRCSQVLRAYDPRRQLERGWSLTRDAEGRLVRSVAALAPGARIRTRLADGELDALVERLLPTCEEPGS